MKKLKLGALALFSTTILAACAPAQVNDAVIFKGGKITQDDIYQEMKYQENFESVVRNVVTDSIFEHEFGDLVSDEDIDKAYAEYKGSLDDEEWESELANAGFTEASFRERLRLAIIRDKGIRSTVKVEDKEIETFFKDTYDTTAELELIVVNDEETAKEVQDRVAAGDKFTKIAEELSELDIVSYDMAYNDVFIPDEIKTAIKGLKDGEVSKTIPYDTEISEDEELTTYFIVRQVKKEAKGKDYKKFKDEITEILQTEKLQNQNITNKIIADVFKAQDVVIKDEDLTSIFKDYLDVSDED